MSFHNQAQQVPDAFANGKTTTERPLGSKVKEVLRWKRRDITYSQGRLVEQQREISRTQRRLSEQLLELDRLTEEFESMQGWFVVKVEDANKLTWTSTEVKKNENGEVVETRRPMSGRSALKPVPRTSGMPDGVNWAAHS